MSAALLEPLQAPPAVEEEALPDLMLRVLKIPNPQCSVGDRHGEAQLQDFICAWLEARGIPFESDPSWGVHARFGSSTKPAVLLAAHMDSDCLDEAALGSLTLDCEGGVIRHRGEVGLDCKTGIAIALSVLERLRASNEAEMCCVHVLFTVGEESGQKGAIRSPLPRLLRGVRHAIVIDRMTQGSRAPRVSGQPVRHVVTSYKGVGLLDDHCGAELLQLLEKSVNTVSPGFGKLRGIESPNCADALELRGRYDSEVLAPLLLSGCGTFLEELAEAAKAYENQTATIKAAMERVAPQDRVSSMNSNPRYRRYEAMQRVKRCLKGVPLEEDLWFSCVNLSYDYDEYEGCLSLAEMQETRDIILGFARLYFAVDGGD